jgi:hypothetical protein
VDVLPEQYQWVAIPTNYYLYGVPDKSQRPLIATDEISRAIEDNGFELFFRGITSLEPDRNRSEVWRFRWRWKMLFGQSLKREIYKLTLTTSAEEDLELIAVLNESDNAGPNLTQWLNNNCSDFSRDILSQILEADIEKGNFPIKGLTTPKGVADTVLQTIMDDPERSLKVEKIFQVPGHSQSLGVDNARALSARSLVLYEASIAAFPLAVLALGAYWSASGADLHEQYMRNLDASGSQSSSRRLDESADSAFGTRRLWNKRHRDFRAIMARQTQCNTRWPLAPLRNRRGQVNKDGSLQLLGKANNLITTDFAGMSASSDPQSFCLLAAHIQWQLEVRRDNKPLIRDFEPRWQLFVQWSDQGTPEPQPPV